MGTIWLVKRVVGCIGIDGICSVVHGLFGCRNCRIGVFARDYQMLLSRPVRRWKILTSKFVAVNLFSAFLMVIGFLLTVLWAFIIFQTSDGQLLSWNGKEVVGVSILWKSLYMLVLSFGSVLFTSTFAFMIGTVFRSISMSIVLSLFFYFFGSSIFLFL